MRTPPPAQVRETHSGVVLLCGDRAYKVKKPVRTDFLDFTTPALRELACARELELNRRLAPDVYLGVAHLGDPEGGPAEPVLIMRRMPADRRLSALLDDTDAAATALRALVAQLVRFHKRADRAAWIDRAGTVDAIRARWRSLLDPLGRTQRELVDPAALDRIDRAAMRFLDGRTALLDSRIAEGCLVDGHGDLLAEDIFVLPDGIRVLDCLDFDDQLRAVDRLDDVAFLAMDLDVLGHRALGDRFVADYQRACGDTAPASLRDHYVAYRATVRAKVDAVRASQGDPGAPTRLRAHLAVADRRLAEGAVRLTLVGGLPGTGKSTVAAALAAETGAVVIAADRVRRELARIGEISGAVGRFGRGRYCAANRARVYDELRWRAGVLLAAGVSVILDASWTDPAERGAAAATAADTASDLVQLRCDCPTEVARTRLSARRRHESDATPAIADAMAVAAAPWPEATTVDTTVPIAASVAVAARAWRDRAAVVDPAMIR